MTNAAECSATRSTNGPRSRGRLRPSGVLAAGVILLVSSGIVLISPLLGHVTLLDRSDQRAVAFGWPFAWLHQDQRAVDPPFPTTTGFYSPLENPTSLSWVMLLLDVAVVVAALAAVLALLVSGLRRIRR
ncbi:MAG: hypothetical protein QM638_15610 [Nocardioides sp.]|uniref:hypothetical protein n=1 Tax=Nocardioides sp. TaxID=35761 RepID=UPI0039E487BE